MFAKFTSLVSLFIVAVVVANAQETHTVSFVNNCGRGTPTLVQNGNILNNGGSFTSNGPFPAAIAYLQTGNCGLNGENCMTVEMTLQNAVNGPGSGSSVDFSLIPPLAFNVPAHFEYVNTPGCNGEGATCADANCPVAFHSPSDDPAGKQFACQTDNANLQIVYCP
ncbi:hypothetical protein VKT23_011570 [Stygiomarasmius scandens]|uniref:Glycopeptide n=1 Tax=Marasmiellus scandens TaxID=2682957 RepID=A0ABR1J9H8_9AGAR